MRRVRRKKIREGYCRACGSKLTKPESIARGFGDKCFEKNSMIVFDIREDGKLVIKKMICEPVVWSVK